MMAETNTRSADIDTAGAVAVTVVVPCHNLGQYLPEAIASVEGQTLRGVEIIVVNDGSTDDHTHLALAELKPAVRVVHQSNSGVAAARNRGIENATGRYICCLDSDDRLRPTFLESAAEILDGDPAVGFVSGHFQMFGDRDSIVVYASCEMPQMLVYNSAVEPSVFRRTLWERVGGYCGSFSTCGIEDWDLWISILETGHRAAVLPEVVWEYRVRPNSMSERMYLPDVWSRLIGELYQRHESSFRQHSRAIAAGHAARWAEVYGWLGERERALKWWREQAGRLERALQDRDGELAEQRSWIAELDEAKQWWQTRCSEAASPDAVRSADQPND